MWWVSAILLTFTWVQTARSLDQPPVPTNAVQNHSEAGQARKTVLKQDTPVVLRVTRTVKSEQARVGDVVQLEVVGDVSVGDLIAIPRHAAAWARVSFAKPSSRFLRVGKLALRLETAMAINGAPVPMRGDWEKKGDFPTLQGGDLYALWLVPFFKGEAAVIPKGSKVQALVATDVSFDTTELQEKTAALQESVAHYRSLATKAAVHIYRSYASFDVSGGRPEVMVDGVRVGRIAPERYMTVKLSPGNHTLTTGKWGGLGIKCTAGKEYYVRVFRRGAFRTKAYLELVENDTGENQTYPLQPANAKDVFHVPPSIEVEVPKPQD